MFEVGKMFVWYPGRVNLSNMYGSHVKIVKANRNGVIVELPDGSQKRAARDDLKPPKPKPMPYVRPTAPPVEPRPMLGMPAGMIPAVLPKKWDPMIIVGDSEGTVHAVPTGARALCGYESGTGWQWARGQNVTCERCWQKHLEAEFEKDPIVQSLRKWECDGPISREDYISFNWAGCSIRPWTAEHEDSLPALLQDWPRFYKNARRRERYSERKYGAWAREQVDAMVAELRKKGE